ncbi:MAG: RNA methyltransferase [Candidatus Wallbacteria bacterium HGW-Wallbacteria-1]|jgi:putative N6-adenine-specific DNA methylase|uniref:RNA methyltransferase n=1 Tax=Candidatus Wallbacteria bacterium HGW-Wallbacteria-1 TaxID=2013854 RepID=A0A2N1PMW1_9BACT|nr:MAG: RNA methyltransferase [Candidatus Wallbacteria bacterium HGW-Wallbacteria-1]
MSEESINTPELPGAENQPEINLSNTGPYQFIATATFGLEAVVKREIENLGYEASVRDGGVWFRGDANAMARANLWLRSADRVLLVMGEFPALTFEELFEGTKALPWEELITADGKFTVSGKAIKSTLGSVRACQSIVKKAIVDRLTEKYRIEWFPETGAEFKVQISMLRDVAALTIDTSGAGLHKRGYRLDSVEAPLRETLAAGLIQLSYWDRNRILMDPFCGSGTIAIEAALIARNMAPGLKRDFASEEWPVTGKKAWQLARREAKDAILPGEGLMIKATDRDPDAISSARANASRAGVHRYISMETAPLADLWVDKQYGVVICNPPYGVRLSDFTDINKSYLDFNRMFKKKKGWSVYVLTADDKFPDYFKRPLDRTRKLYNGKIKVYLYQFFGEKPK